MFESSYIAVLNGVRLGQGRAPARSGPMGCGPCSSIGPDGAMTRAPGMRGARLGTASAALRNARLGAGEISVQATVYNPGPSIAQQVAFQSLIAPQSVNTPIALPEAEISTGVKIGIGVAIAAALLVILSKRRSSSMAGARVRHF